MPYQNVPEDKQDAMERCVTKLVDKGTPQEKAIAICYTSIVEGKSESVTDIPYTGDMSGGANEGEIKALAPDVLIGEAVKALDDKGKVGGYLVRFTSEDDPDLTGDFFTAETDFGESDKLPVLYHHGFDKTLGKRKIGVAELRRDEAGVWAEAQLNLRDEYEQKVFELAKTGKLGWSSGAAAHVVDREEKKNAAWVKQWYLAEASLTPTPAEYRNRVVSVKTLQGAGAREEETLEQKPNNIPMEGKIMETNENAPVVDVEAIAKSAAEQAVKAFADSLPEVKAGFAVEVTKDEADQPFESVAEQLIAAKTFEMSHGQKLDPRLKRLSTKAALGHNEGVPSEGGFLLDPQFTDSVMTPMFETGAFTRFVNAMPTSKNFGYLKAVDETDLSAGQVFGGVVSYWRSEAGSIDPSKMKFRRINWELKSLETLMYVTDEELEDAPLISQIANQAAGRALDFKVNNAILRGTGSGTPAGILNSSALVTVTRTDANKVLYGDIVNMYQRLHPAHRANAAWFVNSEVEPQLQQMYLTSSLEAPFISYGEDGIMRMMGKPVYTTEFNSALGSVGDIGLFDLSDYLLFQRGTKASVNPYIQWLTGQEAFKWTLRIDGLPASYSAITPAYGTNTQSPYIVLSASS